MSTIGQAVFDTVTAYLSWDHDRLDAILESVRRDVDFGRWAESRETFRAYKAGLDRHMSLEEEVLFPLFEARSGIVDGPTAVMREEHRAIRSAIDLMGKGLQDADSARFQEGYEFLGEVLPAHNAKEEHVLYPTTDRLLSDADRSRLAAGLQAR